MKEKIDQLTGMFKKITDLLLMLNPWGTTMVFMFGGCIKMLVSVIDPVLTGHGLGSLDKIHPLYFFCSGIFLFSFGAYRKRNPHDKEVEKELGRIEHGLKTGLLNQAQARIHYNAILTDHLDKTIFSKTEKAE